MPEAAASPIHQSPGGRSVRWQGLPPVVSAQTVVLILGSFPGAASLRAGQYYAHPRNRFWTILQALWPRQPLPDAYPDRCDWLLARGLGLWDVHASCERAGSLDSSIRNPQPNDFARLLVCRRLVAVGHNGAESFRHADVVRTSLQARPVPHAVPVATIRLPSTSPANAAWSLERQSAVWAALMSAYRLL